MSDDMLRQDRVIRPAHYILLRREVNDTELPGFEWDPEQLEVRRDWKGMYNKFFGEKDAYDRDSSNVRHDISLELKRRLDAGAINQNEVTKKSFAMLENATDGSYKRIRRRRLDRQFNRLQVKDGGKGMAGFEKSARHRLKGIRFALNFVDDSDDETEQ
ncbi:MAG: hypothetical protein Q9199_007537 [Rusavskia elegans]